MVTTVDTIDLTDAPASENWEERSEGTTLVVDVREFIEAVRFVGGAASLHEGGLPILGCALIQPGSTDGTVRLTATSVAVTAQAEIAGELGGPGDPRVAVILRGLLNFAELRREQDLRGEMTFTVRQGFLEPDRFRVGLSSQHFRFLCADPHAFPTLSRGINQPAALVDASFFTALTSRVLHSVNPGTGYNPYYRHQIGSTADIYEGVFLQVVGSMMRGTTTDRYRIARLSAPLLATSASEWSALIRAREARSLKRLSGSVAVADVQSPGVDGRREAILFTDSCGRSLRTRVSDQQYPDVHQYVLNARGERCVAVTVMVAELAKGLRVALSALRNLRIDPSSYIPPSREDGAWKGIVHCTLRCSGGRGQLELLAQDRARPGESVRSEADAVTDYEGEIQIAVMLNCAHLLEAVRRHGKKDQLVLRFPLNDTKPVIIDEGQDLGSAGSSYLFMPFRDVK